MARRPSKHLRPARPLAAGSLASAVTRSDGRWIVREVPGARAIKTYVCPGCQHPVIPGTPHIVAWPEQATGWAGAGVDERRHWHAGCWRKKR